MAQKSHARGYMERFNGIALMNVIKPEQNTKSRLRMLASEMKDASIEHNVVTNKKEGVVENHYLFEDNSVLNLQWDAQKSEATIMLTERSTIRVG